MAGHAQRGVWHTRLRHQGGRHLWLFAHGELAVGAKYGSPQSRHCLSRHLELAGDVLWLGAAIPFISMRLPIEGVCLCDGALDSMTWPASRLHCKAGVWD